MSARPLESQSLILVSDSESGSDVTEFGPGGALSNHRITKNGASPTARGEKRARGRALCGSRINLFVFTLSALINIVLLIMLVVVSRQKVPAACPKISPATAVLASSPHVNLKNSSSEVHQHPVPPQEAHHHSVPPTPATPTTPTASFTPRGGNTETPPAVTSPGHADACVTSPVTTCGQGSERVAAPEDAGYVNVFRDLSGAEISAVTAYMLRQPSLGLAQRNQNGNYIVGIELYVPVKSEALAFLDSTPSAGQPPREALVSVAFNQRSPPVFQQFVVGPLPAPSRHGVNPRMQKEVPVSHRAEYGMADGYRWVLGLTAERGVQALMTESFGATTACPAIRDARCLMLLGQKISFGLVNETSFVFSTYYKTEFPTIHPLPFEVFISRPHPGAPFVLRALTYAGTSFTSLQDLLTRYTQGSIEKVRRQFPGNVPGEGSQGGSMHLRGAAFPSTPHPPPRQYEPKGPRFSVRDQHVKYLQWSFNVRNSVESGLQIWDARWAGERVVYELSLQEIAVLYAGANPAAMFAHLSDSAFGLGNNARGLVPGVDCPPHARFLSTWVHARAGGTGSSAAQELPNTLCVFEHNSAIPLRRHRYEDKYDGLVDSYLVVRTIIVEYNYDYIIDVVFHNNGAVEARAYATGYIMAQWWSYGEAPFGFRVHDDAVGSVHHHLFHFKLDLDVGGVSNRYETLDFSLDERHWPWLDTLKSSATTTSSRKFQQISFKHHLRRTEKDALYHYNFDTPKYHIFYNDKNKNKFDNVRAYRVDVRGFSKQLLPDAHPAVSSRKWMQQCMAVTSRKEEELKSSSVFSMFDADDPVVDFEDFHRDNDSIVDTDLVTWVTLGMHHIPHTEDVPNTPTVGTEAAILLLPFNFFPECPSMGCRDQVRGETPGGAARGTTRYETYGSQTSFTCRPPPFYGLPSRSQARGLFGRK